MPTETVLSNARIVLADEIVEGHLVLRDGRIAEIGTGAGRTGRDMEGDLLLPGLVELHTDHLEGHHHPRPKVQWNKTAAIQAHDAQVATSGITTVFDALRVGMDDKGDIGGHDAKALAGAIVAAGAEDRLRAEHFIHLRCEVSTEDVIEAFDRLVDQPIVRIASLMDHAPGQRQFADLATYRLFYGAKLQMGEAAFEDFCARRIAESEAFARPARRHIADRCRTAGIALASHDDATAAHVAEAVDLGVSIAEFPTTIEAAAASHAADMKVLMGGPNVVRGGSHSGNVSASTLHADGLLDILSSDYVPFSLLQASFHLARSGASTLPQAIRLVSKTPAETVGLDDRGEIAPGRRADLVRVRDHGAEPPVVREVMRQGRRVA